MSRRLLVAAAALSLLASLVWNANAAALYGWLAPHDTRISVSGVSGTLGEGHATALIVNGRTALENISWRWEPLHLVLGRLQFAVDGGSGGPAAHGQLWWSPSGLSVGDLAVKDTLVDAVALASVGFAPLSGLLEGHIDAAHWQGGNLRRLSGHLRALRVHWTLAQPPFLLGDFSGEVSTNGDGAIEFKVDPGSGPLMASGGAVIDPARGTYRADIWLNAATGADPLLLNLLHSASSPDAQGRYHLASRGSLAPPVMSAAAPTLPAAPALAAAPLAAAPISPASPPPLPPSPVPASDSLPKFSGPPPSPPEPAPGELAAPEGPPPSYAPPIPGIPHRPRRAATLSQFGDKFDAPGQ